MGPRLEPPFPVTPENSAELVAWIWENHSTVFHWACTCQAAVQGRVADAHFRVKDTSNKASKGSGDGEDRVVGNLLVGSAASLPELPDANPHLTVTAFSVALAEELVRTQAQRRQVGYHTPSELGHARRDVLSSAAFSAHKSAGGGYVVKRDLALSIRRPGQEFPDVSRVAAEHYIDWKKAHAGK